MSSRLLAPIVLVCLFITGGARADLAAEIFGITDHLVQGTSGELADGGVIYQPAIIEMFYAENNYQAAWLDNEQIGDVLNILAASDQDGLNPEDYHYEELQSLWSMRGKKLPDYDRLHARFDVLLTDGLVLYVRHLLEGKTDPRQLSPSFNYEQLDFNEADVTAALRDAISKNSIATVVESSRPEIDFYGQMKSALAHYRKLAKDEDFLPIPADTVLKPGESHPSVIALRKRLIDTGYLEMGVGGTSLYDEDLVAAVQQFQQDHGIDVDGVVGKQSFEFLNMSHQQRVDSLRVNMDRLRWIATGVSDDYVVVNIAGFELYYIRNDELVWETPVMTGTVQHQTPVFTKRLKYLEFNPTWTVPRSIIGRSLLPKFRANPQYLLDNDYVLYDKQGQAVDPHSIDWKAATISNFPYRVVQQPGAKNALGRVKFIFPNEYAIYLHDTPSRALFSRSARAFSAGCVRVKDPLKFAELLLDDPKKWPLEQVEALVASREPQRRVFIERDVDMMLMYWTTSPTKGGQMQFHSDVYGNDPAALAALDAPQVVLEVAQQ